MKLSVTKWIIFSGMTWLAIGCMLLSKGFKWMVFAAQTQPLESILGYFTTDPVNPYNSSLIVIGIGLIIGLIKGRTVLAKTAGRITSRLEKMTGKVAIQDAYDKKYFIILALMMGLGMSFRWLPIAPDIKGLIDVAVGSALIHGGMIYFRHAINRKKLAK